MFTTSSLIEPVTTIVLTGGPCSGKSSSLAYLTEKLSDYGLMVFIIPETATLITNNGIDRRKMDRPKQVARYEEAILDMQLSFEETYLRAVMQIFPERKKVLLLDRGVMDIKAFMPHNDFKGILKRKGLSEVALRDRYHAVIHLVTAAEGAREYYTGENNSARLETAEEAILIDRKIRESWLGHPRFRIIDNQTDFQGKIRRTFSAILQILGMPAPQETRERYLVAQVSDDLLPTHQTVEIEQVYLRPKNRDEEIRIKKRGRDGSYLYFLTRTRTAGERIEEEELITEQHYSSLKKLREPGTEVLIKERASFLWNGRHIEIDRYRGRYEGLSVVEAERCEAAGEERAIPLPPFIVVQKTITQNPRYSERRMAMKRGRRGKDPTDEGRPLH
jgi:CYTH domain-containing protein/thymidylate kinase